MWWTSQTAPPAATLWNQCPVPRSILVPMCAWTLLLTGSSHHSLSLSFLKVTLKTTYIWHMPPTEACPRQPGLCNPLCLCHQGVFCLQLKELCPHTWVSQSQSSRRRQDNEPKQESIPSHHKVQQHSCLGIFCTGLRNATGASVSAYMFHTW